MEKFHYLKYLNWCGKNDCNYNTNFSSNFSSLVWKHFAPAKYFHSRDKTFRPRLGRPGKAECFLKPKKPLLYVTLLNLCGFYRCNSFMVYTVHVHVNFPSCLLYSSSIQTHTYNRNNLLKKYLESYVKIQNISILNINIMGSKITIFMDSIGLYNCSVYCMRKGV